MTLTYDMTFLAVLLSGLYEKPEREEKHFCVLHPSAKRPCIRNPYTRYAADMNVLLVYHNLMDDWQDDRKLLSYRGSQAAAEGVSESGCRIPPPGQSDSKIFEENCIRRRRRDPRILTWRQALPES